MSSLLHAELSLKLFRLNDLNSLALPMSSNAHPRHHSAGASPASALSLDVKLSLDECSGEQGDRPDDVGDGLHAHVDGELSWASAGAQRVATSDGTWVVPAGAAVWIPGGVTHDAFKYGPSTYLWLKVSAALSRQLPANTCAIFMPPAMVEAAWSIERATSLGQSITKRQFDEFCALVEPLSMRGVDLPLNDPLLFRPVLQRVRFDPSEERKVEEWARFLRISVSTFNRKFQSEMGMSLGDYRLRLRMITALIQLAQGRDVTETATRIGYRSVSMFIQSFRNLLGITPGRYYEALERSR